jgi:hypothetical protein
MRPSSYAKMCTSKQMCRTVDKLLIRDRNHLHDTITDLRNNRTSFERGTNPTLPFRLCRAMKTRSAIRFDKIDPGRAGVFLLLLF